MFFNAIMGATDTAEVPGPASDFWYQPVLTANSGVRITAMSAMRASACYACVKVLAETLAALPRLMYENTAGGKSNPYPQHPLQDVINLEPNPLQTAMEFWEMQVAFGCLFGQSFAEIIPGARGAVDQLKPLRPDYMKALRSNDGNWKYEYTDPYRPGVKTIYLPDELLRIPGFSFNGVEGIAPVFFASDPIGLSLAAEAFGSKFFSKDATPALVLEHPKPLKPEAVKNIKESWAKAHSGLDNAFSVAVLEEGMKVNTLGAANKDAQFLETRRYQIAEIARYLRIPLHMINELEKSTYSNIEQQGIEFLKYTIRPWLTRIEQRVQVQLISNISRFFMRHNTNELVMGEVSTRYASYAAGINSGWLTRNEVRQMEGRNPLPGLDEPLTPMNMGGDQPGTPKAPGTPPKQPSPSQSRLADYSGHPVLVDAFDRIISSEVSAIETICKKHKGDARSAKLSEFYTVRHRAYIEKTLTPFENLVRDTGNASTPSAVFAQKYTDSALHMLLAAENVTDFCDKLESDAGKSIMVTLYCELEIANA